jgi:Dullard-like phosphatase family protein
MEDLQSYFRGLRLDREATVTAPLPAIYATSPHVLSEGSEDGGETTHSTGDEVTAPLIQLAELSVSSYSAQSCHGCDNSTTMKLAGSSSSSMAPLLGYQQQREVYGRNVLVLDLDETLVHSSHSKEHFSPALGDKEVAVEDAQGRVHPVYVKLRPHLMTFLLHVSRMFEVVVFTAGLQAYAEAVMRCLDPLQQLYHHLLTRAHCTVMGSGSFVKDLSFLGRPLNRVIIIDNSPVAYVLQPRNAIPCTTWLGDPTDNELQEILQLLHHCALCTDVFTILDPYHRVLDAMLKKDEEEDEFVT